VVLALGTVYVLWGSTYLGMRIAVETIPPFLMAGVRYGLAGLILYLWARWRGAPRPEPVHWRSAAVIGALLLMIGNGGVVWAEQKVASGLASLLVATEALWIVLLQWLRRGGVRPGWRTFTGVGFGFTGLAILLGPGAKGALEPAGAVALLLAALSWAIGSLYAQKAPLPETPLLATGMQMLCGGGLLMILGAVTGEAQRFDPSRVSNDSLLAMTYLLVFGSLIGFTAYSWLLRNVSPTLASTYAYVNPVVAVFLGWALAGEPVTATTIVAAAVIVTGVALITSASGPKKAEAPGKSPAEEPSGSTTGRTRSAGRPAAVEVETLADSELEPETCGAR
jgi:drug/metabolite transporter (DMT)-like permease